MLAAIAAVDEDFGLGYEGHLQFHIREDLRRFAALTRGHAVIYGRKTLETFPGGKPVKDRENIIISRPPGSAPFPDAPVPRTPPPGVAFASLFEEGGIRRVTPAG